MIIQKKEYVNENGERVIELREAKITEIIPKELHWVFHLRRKGYALKFWYGNESHYNLMYWHLDSEKQSYIPQIPDRVEVFKFKPGKGWIKVRELRRSELLVDPPIEVALKFFEFIEKEGL